MKTKIFFLMMVVTHLALGQSFTEKISKEMTFEKQSADNALIVANMNGHVKVVGYKGDKILVEVSKSIYAKTESRLENAKADLKLGVIDRADTLVLYVEDGCNHFEKRKGRSKSGWHRHGWGYNWNDHDGDCRLGYDYKMDFTIKVPETINVMVSTINDGDVVVENVKGVVLADNINGSIRLSNLEREAGASTINGDVDIEYLRNPNKDCRFYSLNGDINAIFQPGLAANLSFESFNGNFYTNIDKLESLPVKVEKTKKEGDGIKFKVNGNRYQVRAGGALLDFETFNGDVFLKEKTSN